MNDELFNLFDLLEWLEALLDHRHEHIGERYMFFATDERYLELHIAEDEVSAGAVTNHNLRHEQWLSEVDVYRLAVMGWDLDCVEGADPRYMRWWSWFTPTVDIVSEVLRVLTAVYLDPAAERVQVVRASNARV